MATQVSPGVLVTEKDLTVGLGQVALTEGALAGYFQWGPVDQVNTVASEEDLVTRFFKPNNNAAPYFFTGANFLAYSNTLRLVRVVDEGVALNASQGTTTATGTVLANSATVNVIGTGTAFTSELSNGQSIVVNGETLTVNTVTNATHLVLASAPASNASAQTAIIYGQYIKNEDDYNENWSAGQGTFGVFAAKYPGTLGNSLRVEMCASANAYESNTGLTITVSSGNTTVTSSGNVVPFLQVGDIITANGEARSVTNVVSGGLTFVINSAFSSALTTSPYSRRWKYAKLFDTAPGTSAYASDRGGVGDEMHVVVVDEDGAFTTTPGTVLERFAYLSKASDAKSASGATNYYKDVINRKSDYVWQISQPSSGGTSWGSVAASTTFGGQYQPMVGSLVGGVAGGSLTNADLIRGYNKFRDEQVEFSFVLGANSNATVATHIIQSVAEERKYAMAFLSPLQSDVVDNANGEVTAIIAFRNSLPSSSYAVLDSGWKYQYDKYNDIYRYVPCNGDTAGCAVRADQNGEAWFSPAGYSRGAIKNVIKLAFNPRQSDRDDLYRNGIDPIVSFPGQGTVLFGDKTLLNRPSAFDRINVRRLFIVLEKTIEQSAKQQLFEQNDDFTRQQFVNIVEPFLRSVKSRRGITDFMVVCDGTNNPQDAIDRNEFRADILVKPVRSINYIQLNFVAVRSDVAFNEIITNLT